ncbi:MAG: glycosyltransferase family 2 protein [Candidatus Omnitrophica bacterium]|nr:glycosyltransferase family 2 protein [Candidatus Omnitrophota bacterium]
MLTFLFWLCLGLIIYCYFLYPAILWVVALFSNKIVHKDYSLRPSVSIVMSVWNEEKHIAEKLSNLLSLDYPEDKLEILVGSDGSDDATVELSYQFKDNRVKFFDYRERRGKMSVLNDLLKEAKNDIVLFCDARQRFEIDVIRELVANFADPKVGCVSGELILESDGRGVSESVGAYWSYEKFIRAQEGRIHSIMGATGAIYAIRRGLFKSLPVNIVLDDMFIPFCIIQQGYRAIFDVSAKAFDKVAQSPEEEHRRKVRTLAGNFQIFALFPFLFNPAKSPIAIQLFSHKFLRLQMPFLMIFLFVLNIFLVTRDPVYLFILLSQIAFYGSAVFCPVSYMFCVLNFAALEGLWRFLTAQQQVTWEKAKA